MAEWFEDWFNTDEYLDVYRNRNDAEAKVLVELILQFVKLPPKADVLDLACGAGRHSIHFAENGFNVTAVDLSENLLRVAKNAAEKNKVKIDFIKSDIRNFIIDKKFDLIVDLFTSFGYFENDKENLMLFKTAFKYLNQSGYFVIDYFNANFIRNYLTKESEDHFQDYTLIQKRRIENNRVIKDIYINRNGIENHYMESVRMYNKDELLSAIEATELKIKNIFGGFNAEKFDEVNSQRIIIVAQK